AGAAGEPGLRAGGAGEAGTRVRRLAEGRQGRLKRAQRVARNARPAAPTTIRHQPNRAKPFLVTTSSIQRITTIATMNETTKPTAMTPAWSAFSLSRFS